MFQMISDPMMGHANELGNKGKNLCLMYQAGFLVPEGFILDGMEYRSFLAFSGITSDVEKLLKEIHENNVKEVSERIKALFSGKKFADEIMNKIRENVDASKQYAVRSSCTKEDLADYSFAGQYDTFLNVQGVERIADCIIECYKSIFSEVSLSYFINHSIDMKDIAMAVVVQEMVQSDYSGICFTVNPITGNDKEMSIEVGKGLGDNLVSGKVAPEQYFYNWYEKEVSPENKYGFLTEEQVGKFGEVFLKIQLLFGYPCDIEFAITNGNLYILQARSITKINYDGIDDVWSTADFKDGGVSATVCTPYMWSLYEYIWEFTLRKFMLDGKILSEKEVNKKLGNMFFGRCYWNLSVVKLAMSNVVGYKEREFDSEYGIHSNYEGDGHVTGFTLQSLTDITRMFFAQKKILKERKENSISYKEDLLNKYEHYKKMMDEGKIGDIEKIWYDLTKKTYLQSEATYFWQIFINTIHQSLYKDGLLKYVSESEYLTLLGAIDNISHLLPFYDMWEISRTIRNDNEACIFWQENTMEVLLKELDSDSHCMPLIKEVIEKYGYHSDKELDVTYPCYYEDPRPLLETIKDMLRLDEEFSPMKDKKRGEENYQNILQTIEHKVGKRKYQKIYKRISGMREMLWWREEYRDIYTRFYYLIRIYTMKLAKYWVEKGIIHTEEDIWYVKVARIWDYLDHKISEDELCKDVLRNREYYNAYSHFMSENEIGGGFVKEKNEMKQRTDQGLKGLGANSGIVTGTARVIEDFSQISRLQENDILITRFTDTGWTSKFAILSGIVTEYGGILCHAAIVSREYGIPAIVNCHDIMSKIKDGQTITIDGSTGMITLEENKEIDG